jgi:hypothetical protein
VSVGKWWKQKSGQAKTVTALAVLLMLQIGLCFSTPAMMPWYESIFGPSRDSELGLGLMIGQGLLCLVNLVVLFVVVVAWLPGLSSGKKKPRRGSNDR